LDCGDEAAIVQGFVLGAGFCAIAFLFLVDFVAGAALVPGPADDLVALKVAFRVLLDVVVGASCEYEGFSRVGARETGGKAG
jgi:hypothetical protein